MQKRKNSNIEILVTDYTYCDIRLESEELTRRKKAIINYHIVRHTCIVIVLIGSLTILLCLRILFEAL